MIVLAFILLLAFGLRMAFVHEPFERDEGFYGYIGQEILRGATLYRDVADIKPPGIYFIYAFMISIVGNSMEGIRIITALYAVGTTLIVYRLARLLGGWRCALGAGLLFVLFSNAPLMQGDSSNTEVFMLLPLTLAVYLLMLAYDRDRPSFFAWSGFFSGIALIVKTVAAPYVAVLFACIALRTTGAGGWRTRLKEIAVFLLPPLATALFVIAYFVQHGALAEMYYWNVTIFDFYIQSDWHFMLANLKKTASYLFEEQILLWVSAAAGAVVLLKRKDVHGTLVAALLPASFVGVAMPGHFIPHYFIQLTPFCAVAGGAFLARLGETRGAGLAAALVATGLVLHLKADYPYYLVYSPAEVSTHKYEGYPVFAESIGIARYIKDHTGPDDRIVQWGWEPELYFYSNRRGMRNIISFLSIVWAPDELAAMKGFIVDLARDKPKYIIVQKDEDRLRYSIARGYHTLKMAIDRDYILEHQEGYARIYRLAAARKRP